jgi:hypothetical protein
VIAPRMLALVVLATGCDAVLGLDRDDAATGDFDTISDPNAPGVGNSSLFTVRR